MNNSVFETAYQATYCNLYDIKYVEFTRSTHEWDNYHVRVYDTSAIGAWHQVESSIAQYRTTVFGEDIRNYTVCRVNDDGTMTHELSRFGNKYGSHLLFGPNRDEYVVRNTNIMI